MTDVQLLQLHKSTWNYSTMSKQIITTRIIITNQYFSKPIITEYNINKYLR